MSHSNLDFLHFFHLELHVVIWTPATPNFVLAWSSFGNTSVQILLLLWIGFRDFKIDHQKYM